MTRVSMEEQYNNKDVITQILKMRDDIARIAANAAGIQDITLTTTATGWKFTFTLTDGTSYVFPLDTTGYITDAELATALADYYTKTEIDNAFANYYTKTETDTALGAKADDNAVVKLAGNQTISDTKTFNSSPIVPDTPATEHSAINQDWAENVAYSDDTVNNLMHKEGNENILGQKRFNSQITVDYGINRISTAIDVDNPPTNYTGRALLTFVDINNVEICSIWGRLYNDGTSSIRLNVRNSNGTYTTTEIMRGSVI